MRIQRASATLTLAVLSFGPVAVAQEEQAAQQEQAAQEEQVAQEEQAAQEDADGPKEGFTEEIVVSGYRGSLRSAVEQKRASDNLIEVIESQDVGKLPDQNLAEVLENVTGIQITRAAGVGNSVQIRGTDENRTLINGVSTVGSGAGRGGISFEDISSSLISSVEVIKAPQAKTIEGSVGGTINLKTIRPLELTERVAVLRTQGENSELATDAPDLLPRINGTYGNKWSTDSGDFGIVVSAAYAEQDVTAFRPRVDRDGIVLSTNTALESAEEFDFLRIQFFNQDYDNFEYETLNFVGSLEWAPTERLKFYFDAVHNDQVRRQESTRVQLSGVSDSDVVSGTDNTAFETVDLGSLDGRDGRQDLGSVQAATRGFLFPDQDPFSASGLNPNLRASSDTGARETDSQIFILGGEWLVNDRLFAQAELSTSNSDSFFPNFSTTLDFINPNSAQPLLGESIDNGVPLAFDLTDGLTFGLLEGHPTTPTTAQLLDPANYQLRQVQQGLSRTENGEDALRVDLTYDMTGRPFFTSIEAGYRFNETSSLNDSATNSRNLTNSTRDFNRPSADLFSDIIVAGPDNFNSADGRRLYIGDFLIINPELAYSDPQRLLEALNAAISARNAATGDNIPLLTVPTSSTTAFFDIAETTHALYTQANFKTGIFRGDLGLRFVDTTQESLGNSLLPDGTVENRVETSSYSFVLPRLNIAADLSDSVVLRGGFSKDINRPDFDDLSTSLSFATSPNDPVVAGNPNLVPEEVLSFDASLEWYFAEASVLSVGVFHKIRSNLFVEETENPPANADPQTGQLNVDITPPCEEGGIYNPIADRNVLNPETGTGICVPFRSTFNGAGETTQSGVELAFQFDLSRFEDRLGWASGFGFLGNYTYQDFSGSDSFVTVEGGGRDIFLQLGLTGLTSRATLLNLSEHAYNLTLFYEKGGLSARMRYSWRSAFRSDDDDFFDLFVVEEARGQLNASVAYAFNESLSLTVEGINLTQSDAEQSCINEGALLCFQDLTDRRLLIGASYRF